MYVLFSIYKRKESYSEKHNTRKYNQIAKDDLVKNLKIEHKFGVKNRKHLDKKQTLTIQIQIFHLLI